jgi:uncharacterized protein (DUF433 family)
MPEPQTIRLAETSIGKPLPTYFVEGVFDPELVSEFSGYYETTAAFYAHRYSVQWKANVNFELGMARASGMFIYRSPLTDARGVNRALAERLCQEHPDISTYPGIFGGAPHIKGVRFSVGNVLSELYLQGSVSAVAETFSLDENQIKEAIAYAQDFLESALSPRSEVDG